MKLIQGGLVKTITGGDIRKRTGAHRRRQRSSRWGRTSTFRRATEIIDAAGCIVTPGFVDAHCHIGMHEEASALGGQRHERVFRARLRRKFAPSTASTRGTRRSATRIGGGVTTAVTGPGSANVLGGTFVAMKLYGDCVDDMILKYPAAMKMRVRREPQGRATARTATSCRLRAWPSRRTLREMLFKAQRYAKEIEEAEKDAAKTRPFDMKLEALLPGHPQGDSAQGARRTARTTS